MKNNRSHIMQKQTKDPEKLKRAVIKEEFVAITNDFVDAVILNQFLYWTERVKDLGELIEEEKKRESSSNIEANIYNDDSFEHGWFYKSAKQLNEETMLGMGSSTINRHIKALVDKGLVKRRRNEKYKWDRTWQYRVDINKVAIEVEKAGYTMQGYKFLQTQDSSQGNAKMENAFSKKENGSAKKINRRSINVNQNTVKHHRNTCKDETIPEITTETNAEIEAETTSDNKYSASNDAQHTISPIFPSKDIEPSPQTEPEYITYKGKKLSGRKLEMFLTFWETFGDKRNKAKTADAWLEIKNLEAVYPEIIEGAKKYANIRPALLLKKLTPKMAEGWLRAKRWEDEIDEIAESLSLRSRREVQNAMAVKEFLEDGR